MPQMMPMFWLLIFIASLTIFLMLIVLIYFFNLYKLIKLNYQNYPKFKWLWKW